MANKKILIVEDNKDFLWLLRQNFQPEPLQILFALDGEEGLKKAQAEKPDFVIIDLKLTDETQWEGKLKTDGMVMAKAIRDKGINCPFLFLTSFSSSEKISQAVEATKDADYIVKESMLIEDIVKRVKQKLKI